MSKKLVPWVAYPGSTLQNTYSEDLEHGYLLWDIDTAKKQHTVDFVGLPNPRPFVTIEWQGDVDSTFGSATAWPQQSRFRVRSTHAIPTSDAASLSARLRKEKQATEVIFKSNDEESAKKFAAASLGADVRSFDAVEDMLREYYSDEEFDDATWDGMRDALKSAHSRAMLEDDIARGTVWTLRRLEFDNLYGYGAGNSIDFDGKNGIVGVFGPNALGKSSIVGSILYTLHNTSDRDISKNAHIVNTRKKSGRGRAIIAAAGSEYEIERKSEKVVSRGLLTANTSLTFKQLDGECEDLTGDLRPDTEKNIRKVIGTYEDFVITCGSVQDDVARFLKEGPTQRKAILSRFLGIDVFEKLYAHLNSELTETKSKLKGVSTREQLLTTVKSLQDEQEKSKHDILVLEAQKIEVDAARSEAYVEMQKHAATVELRKKVAEKNHLVERSMKVMLESAQSMTTVNASIETAREKAIIVQAKLEECLTWDEMDARRSQIHDAKLAVEVIRSSVNAKTNEVERSKKIALKLLDVPCGDQYPACVYIKDAHEEKGRVDSLQRELNELLEKHSAAIEIVVSLDEKCLDDARKKRKTHEDDLVALESGIRRHEATLNALREKHDKAKADAAKYTTISLEDSDVEQRHAAAIDSYNGLTRELASIESQLKTLSSNLGKLEANVAKTREDLDTRVTLERQGRIRELLVNAFSRRGIPNVMLNRLLPIVNDEMSKILGGAANFNITLIADDATNALEIYIDDGGSKDSLRPLELGSGMEKMMASLALRTALSNLTTLPKTDFMIIDEGFGALDPSNAVACVSLLRSIKRFFRFVLVISHIDIIKDAVDCHIDVTTTADGAQVISP